MFSQFVSLTVKFKKLPRLRAVTRVGIVLTFLHGAIFQKRDIAHKLIANRKSYTVLRFVQKWMTLNDLERSKRICDHR